MKVELDAATGKVALTGMTLNEFRLLVVGAEIGRRVAADDHKQSECTAPRCDASDLMKLVDDLTVQAAPALVLWQVEDQLRKMRNDAAAKGIAADILTKAKGE